MSNLALVLRQARYDNRAFWRNPAASFFTFIFPLMFLFIFNVMFGDGEIDVPGGAVDTSTFYVPAILAFSIINACYTSLSQLIANARDDGLLKRLHSTPIPPLAFILGRVLQSIWVMILLVIVVLGAGIVFYGVDLSADRIAALVVAVMVGAAAFCALGLAVSSLIPNADAAPAVINASILPLLFISNVFIPTASAPEWLTTLASIFPVVHLADALHSVFNPFEEGSGFEPVSLAVMAVWGVLGIAFAVRYFTWEPRR